MNFSVAVRAPSTGQVEFKAFAGPTFFRAEADAVDTIRNGQVWIGTSNLVEILSTGTRKVDSTAWGFHAGADVGFFFSRHVGFGLTGRFSRGEVTIQDDNLIGEGPVDVRVGGTQIAGGLRIRFQTCLGVHLIGQPLGDQPGSSAKMGRAAPHHAHRVSAHRRRAHRRSPESNPYITIMALADRVAEVVRARLPDLRH